MKNTSIVIKITTVFILFLSACSGFLDEKPQTALTQEDVYKDLAKIDPLVLGLYTNWRNTKKDRGGFMFSLGSDETQQGAYQVRTVSGQAGLDRYNDFLAPGNTALAAQWDSRWPVISSAATAIYALKANNQDPVKKNMLMGEASFIRAALTFEIAQYWGEIPIIDLDKLSEYGTARQPLKVVYGAITKDLETAIEHLPTSQNDKRRATKGAAQALLGKVYLYAPQASGFRDYEKAKLQFSAVISGGYSLAPSFASLWEPDKPNPAESIFSFQFSPVRPDNNQIQWQTGSRACATVSQYCYFGGYDLLLPTQYCYNTVDKGGIWEEGDQRKEASIRYDFTYKGKKPVVQGWMGGDELDPHIKKYEDTRLEGTTSFWYSGKNVYFLRYADILLCYAETLNETGNTAQAVAEVNKVRTRAWGGTLPPGKEWGNMSQAEFRTKIMDERMRELCFEGWRRMDLIRTGNLVSLVKSRNKWANQSGTIQEFHNRYPIPLQEILQNEDIDEKDQNPGYVNR